MESVAPVASFTRAKTHSPGVMKESEDGTDQVKVPVFRMRSDFHDQPHFKERRKSVPNLQA